MRDDDEAQRCSGNEKATRQGNISISIISIGNNENRKPTSCSSLRSVAPTRMMISLAYH